MKLTLLDVRLCISHHIEKHNIGIKDFEEKYHIEGVWLNPNLVFKMLDIYPNHFKLFRKRLKANIIFFF